MSEYFEGMTDLRQEAKVKHSFIETIMIVICAVIAGCDVWEDIADNPLLYFFAGRSQGILRRSQKPLGRRKFPALVP